ncbi:MAG: hypothetical protein JWP01_3773 [Myxococcales bacterium]|nr:hypothetical protein [Myxococcales bacterium]
MTGRAGNDHLNESFDDRATSFSSRLQKFTFDGLVDAVLVGFSLV